ncbi:terpenoid synthase [Marasmius fiardii PR-910]|nr:terpenoid synthase [Marasmius fiardii PR-910]
MDLYNSIVEKLSAEPTWTPQNERTLLEPFTFVTSNPGKDMRGRLIEAFNLWLKVSPEKLAVIARIVNMLHAASLMVDDIEDDSHLRRGKPVAHKVYGIPQTLNSANYVYFLAFQELFALRGEESTDLAAIVNGELLALHRGQGLEILWRDSLRCPTEEEYIEMVNNKTGGLLRIGIKLMMACATTNKDVDYVPLVNLIGVHFQIRDDLMNLQSAEYTSNKGFAEDLSEGKFSFPVVHSIHTNTSNRQVLNILQKRPTTPTLKHYAIDYMENTTKSFEYTFGVLEVLEGKVKKEIERLGGNPGLEAFVESFRVDKGKFSGKK